MKKRNPLSLEGLAFPTFDKEEMERIRKEQEKEQQPYKEKYGKDWALHWFDDKIACDHDAVLKAINTAIYHGTVIFRSGPPDEAFERKVEERVRSIYGEGYSRYYTHENNDPKVNEALLKDAEKNRKMERTSERITGGVPKKDKTKTWITRSITV